MNDKTLLVLELADVLRMSVQEIDSCEDVVFGKLTVDAMRGQSEFVAFYDWLRRSKTEIVGVRWAPFEDLEHELDLMTRLSFCRVNDRKWVEIYWGSTDYDETISDDADFGGSRFIRLDASTAYLTFGLDLLSAAEQSSIRSFC